MENPWIQLPKGPPFILPCDKKLIDVFNGRQHNTPFEIILNEIPSPYIGSPEAPIVLLNLNPCYSSDESNHPEIARFREIARANLLHKFYEYPFYVFDPKLKGTPSGYKWFCQKFGPLVCATGMSYQEISKKLFLVEYFPYKSLRCSPKWKQGILPSQKYAISLIEKAIARKAIIIIMRSERLWFDALPILKEYSNCYTLHNPQNVSISENNLGVGGFRVMLGNLRK